MKGKSERQIKYGKRKRQAGDEGERDTKQVTDKRKRQQAGDGGRRDSQLMGHTHYVIHIRHTSYITHISNPTNHFRQGLANVRDVDCLADIVECV